MAQPRPIRPLYDEYGPDVYYRDHAGHYANPHFPQVKALLERNAGRLDLTHVLDFAAGGGEVTQVVRSMGAQEVTGCDPYTYALYEQQTGLRCLRHSFKDVLRGALAESSFSLIVSSFALHLCSPKELYPLAWQLLQCAPLLVVITPHKRPDLGAYAGIGMLWEDEVLTEREKRVRIRAYGYG